MKDLTQGSIAGHILSMSVVMLIGMAGQTAYFLVDLYFVAHLGPEAIAGVNAAGTLSFVVMALTQMLASGFRLVFHSWSESHAELCVSAYETLLRSYPSELDA